MPTTRTAIAAVLLAALLCACSQRTKKNVTPASSAPMPTLNVIALPDENILPDNINNNFLQQVTQRFLVAKNKTAVVKGKKGLRITVNPSALEKEDGGAVDGAIQVSIVELTSTEDLFAANAATVSNGRLLASGGSYFIQMMCNGSRLQIKKGQHLQVDFPVLQQNEMELFYGQRDAANNINWIPAGQQLQPAVPVEDSLFTGINNNTIMESAPVIFTMGNEKEAKVYKSLDEEVYLCETKLSIAKLVDTVNSTGAKIRIDTIYPWPKPPANLPKGAFIDSNFLYRMYGPPQQFIIVNYRDEAAIALQKQKAEAARQEAIEKWQPQTLNAQIQKYYAPSAIISLGWLNCDRIYNSEEKVDIPLTLPITKTKPNIHYFIIYKNFNGLVSGILKAGEDGSYILSGLPKGEKITLIAFTKLNNQLYHSKTSLQIGANVVANTNFTAISNEAVVKMFGKNVRI
jgi:hypothetical protein